MKLTAARGFCGVERFIKLDCGGDDDRCVPVLSSEAGLLSFYLWRERGVMLDEWSEFMCLKWSKNVADDLGVLFDDRGERDDEDDTGLAVANGVKEREQKRRECFSSTRGDSEREESGGFG